MSSARNRIRVLHFIPDLGMGGAEHVVARLAVYSDRKRFHTHVASFSKEQGTQIERDLREAGIRLSFFDKIPGFDLRMFRKADSLLSEWSPDVVHTHRHALRYVFPSLKLRNIAAFHTIHNMPEHETDRPGRMIKRVAFHSGVQPVAISACVAKASEKFYQLEKIDCVLNAIPVRHYQPNVQAGSAWRETHGIKPAETLVTVLGRLSPQKNPTLAIKALAACPQRLGAQIRLAFVGDGPLLPELKKAASDHGLTRQVLFPGISNNVAPVLSGSDVVLMCSDWEGTPLVVMEAMAAGCPVIATEVGAVATLVEHSETGFIVPPGDAKSIADNIHLLAERADVRRSIGTAARNFAVQHFDIPQMIHGYEMLYESAHDRLHREVSA